MKKNLGKLIGLSLGPGDPGLITRQAYEALTGEAQWCYPVKKRGAESYALSIALAAGLTPPEGHQALLFPMTHDPEKLLAAWKQAALEVLELLSGGRDLLFLVEGDSSTYSTFGHLARTLKQLEPLVPIETWAGVSSFNAAAARLEMPLAEVDDKLAVIPAGYGVAVIERLLEDFDRLVLLKVKPVLDEVIDLVERLDLIPYCRFIEKAGSPEERQVLDISTLRGQKVNYLSLILIHHPNRLPEELKRGCKKVEP
ncbi:MAG: precorrin-2 C(20)-methyltransferase [Candidatus Lambdaproteobacteria bacterium RIFOXYD2_FULL_50_16]|uniref:Precorrin-2 C(20)-methyltransferase n=1 Tax=Candidatus Lambdaproteobacteria bacterium RIFOXYD2_FULL_50_16 TaxID=1817772 RepID=A0A1F6G8S7_9PROT|nr:MAG: precorrin-2 C(20)-methyltransferase [Candidatus Lambdaproteobacteria bacterium RIFOXYD2_FULL_50_16]